MVTFLFFPLLVMLAYLADIKACCFSASSAKGDGGKVVSVTKAGKAVTADDVSRAYAIVTKAGANGDDAQAVRDLLAGPRSKAYYKTAALDSAIMRSHEPNQSVVSFEHTAMSVALSSRWVELLVLRTRATQRCAQTRPIERRRGGGDSHGGSGVRS